MRRQGQGGAVLKTLLLNNNGSTRSPPQFLRFPYFILDIFQWEDGMGWEVNRGQRRGEETRRRKGAQSVKSLPLGSAATIGYVHERETKGP